MRVEVKLHPVQKAFIDSTALIRGFVGGRGSGKTRCGSLDLLLRAKPGRLYGVYAPTYTMLKDATMRTLLDSGEQLHFVKQVNRSDMTVTLGNGAEIVCRSTDDPERSRGLNLSGAWLDEASIMKSEAYTIILASLRERGQQGWLTATFTPKGKSHWTYEVFGSGRDGIELFHSRTEDNPFLPPTFAELVRSQYPTEYARQELEGQFIDPQGAVFKREWFRVVEKAPEGIHWVRYWDLAVSTKTTADYTASVALGMGQDGTIYLRDMVRGKWEWPDQERVIIQTMLNEPNTIHGIEKALHGIAAVQSLVRRQELTNVVFYGIDVERDKVTRALPFAARAEQGKVVLVAGEWIGAFLDELASFTGDGSSHDDQVDSASGGLLMLARHERNVEYAPSLWG